MINNICKRLSQIDVKKPIHSVLFIVEIHQQMNQCLFLILIL